MQHPLSKMSGALAAASLVAITQILTTHPDHALRVAVRIFAFCLPLLVGMAFIPPVKRLVDFPELTKKEVVAFAGFMYVAVADIVGFGFVFFHFGNVAGFAFVVSCFLALRQVTNWKTALGLLGLFAVFPVVELRTVLRKMRGGASEEL